MPWLVDAMNVIGSRPDGWWRDRAGAVRIHVAALRRFAEATGDEVWTVVDGTPRDVGEAAPVRVVWAAEPGRDAADRIIARMVEADDDPARWRVVTSDGDLAARVRAAGADVVAAGSFRRRLEEGDAPRGRAG